MTAAAPAYHEIIEFIASGATSEAVAGYRPSPKSQRRVAELIAREQETGLSAEEKSELDHHMELEHIMRMAKAKAKRIIALGK
jgi:hypothetical protein